jgi:GMP synthase-like glutamine amidotransferase
MAIIDFIKLAAGEKIPGGLADNKPATKYSDKELQMGVDVEFEHTNDRATAREIAKDHLEEIPDYYTRLAKMEAKAEEAQMIV